MLRPHYLSLGALLYICLAPTSAEAIVIRHDRPDARYVDLAKDFRALGDVVEAGSTLVAPRWLLTAAHVAKEITPYTSFVSIAGKSYAIDRVILHPDHNKDRAQGRRDLALLRLASEVRGVEPIPLYRGEDETGQIVTFFGRGQTGNGLTGPAGEDGKLRGATNKLERVTAENVFFQFDQPDTATELEGISGPGDSGGPALIKVNGKWAIAGVSSANIGMGAGPCRYDTTEVYARVSTAAPWIDQTIKTSPPSTFAWQVSAPFQEWPKTRPGEVAAALISAYNSGNSDTFEAFSQTFRDAQALKRATPEQRSKGYADLFKRIGKVKTLEYVQGPTGNLLVLLENEKRQLYQLSMFFFDQENKRFDGYWIGEAKARAKAPGPRGG